jgi:hypothetical protein
MNWKLPIATIIGVIAGSIAIVQAYPEYYYLAHRGYVIDHVSNEHKAIVELRLAQNDIRSDRLVEKAKQYELDLQSEQAKQLPQYRALLQERVERINHDIQTIDEQNKSLMQEKTK